MILAISKKKKSSVGFEPTFKFLLFKLKSSFHYETLQVSQRLYTRTEIKNLIVSRDSLFGEESQYWSFFETFVFILLDNQSTGLKNAIERPFRITGGSDERLVISIIPYDMYQREKCEEISVILEK